MKNLFKRIVAAFTGLALAVGSVPLNIIASAQMSPVNEGKHGMLSAVSDEYIEYINSDNKDDTKAVPAVEDIESRIKK